MTCPFHGLTRDYRQVQQTRRVIFIKCLDHRERIELDIVFNANIPILLPSILTIQKRAQEVFSTTQEIRTPSESAAGVIPTPQVRIAR